MSIPPKADQTARVVPLRTAHVKDEPPYREPPKALEASEAYLGAVLLKPAIFLETADLIEPAEHFVDFHRLVHSTAMKMHVSGETVSPITVGERFAQDQLVDGKLTPTQYLLKLCREVPCFISAPGYARSVRRAAAQRRLILLSEDIANGAHAHSLDESPEHQVAQHQKRLAEIALALSAGQSAEFEAANCASVGSLAAYSVKGLFPSASVIAVYGVTTAGKTFWLLDGGFCVSHGKAFMGRRVRKGAVLYIALEGRSGFGKRIAAAISAHGDPGANFARFKSLVALGRSPQAEADVARIIAACRALAKQAGVPVSLVIIDTLARALGGSGDDENQAAAISAVVGQANRIASETGAAVIIAHHPGKDADRGMRGSYALAADFDVIVKLEREAQSEMRHVILEKAKDGEEGPIGSFTLERVVLGQDEDGDDITSCIVRYVEGLRPAQAKRPSPHTAAGKALNELDHLTIDGRGEQSRGHARIPDGVFTVKRSDWQAACLEKSLSNGDAQNEARVFRRATAELEKAGLVGAYGDVVWPMRADKQPRSDVCGRSARTDRAGQSAATSNESGQLQ